MRRNQWTGRFDGRIGTVTTDWLFSGSDVLAGSRIEEAGTPIGLIEELKYGFLGLIPVRPDRDKIARMAIASAKFEAGNIYLPEEADVSPKISDAPFPTARIA